jgi:hypothetical protein
MRGRDRFLLVVALTLGALWGAFAYAVLWNDTPIVVTRQFFESPTGVVLLFPVRVVLWGIRMAETKVAHHAFRFPDNTRWIGGLAALVGALLVGAPAFVLLRISEARAPRSRSNAGARRSGRPRP